MPLQETGAAAEDVPSEEQIRAALTDVGSGWRLPTAWYASRAVYARECDRVVGRSWQFAGLATDVEAPGTYRAATSDREFIVTRDSGMETADDFDPAGFGLRAVAEVGSTSCEWQGEYGPWHFDRLLAEAMLP